VVALVAAPSKVAAEPIAGSDDINFLPIALANVSNVQIPSGAIE
jgi:hypothetical protein